MKPISFDLRDEKAKKLTWLQCDIGDWKGVTEVAKNISSQTDRIDILINDAVRGIMTYQLTSMVSKGAHTVQIFCLGSNVHQTTPSDCSFTSLPELNADLGPNGQYGRSKLAQMLYCKYLSKNLTARCPKILANSVHPGFVESQMSVEDIHEPRPVAGYAMSVGMKSFK